MAGVCGAAGVGVGGGGCGQICGAAGVGVGGKGDGQSTVAGGQFGNGMFAGGVRKGLLLPGTAW